MTLVYSYKENNILSQLPFFLDELATSAFQTLVWTRDIEKTLASSKMIESKKLMGHTGALLYWS